MSFIKLLVVFIFFVKFKMIFFYVCVLVSTEVEGEGFVVFFKGYNLEVIVYIIVYMLLVVIEYMKILEIIKLNFN